MTEGPETTREPVALSPGAAEDQNRRAYLSLLKLALTDLAGPRTRAVHSNPEGVLFTRELEAEELKYRAAGIDWPVNGLTMTGLSRLDDLQDCVESVVEEGIPGDMIEAGAWRGGSSILMRATLDSLGDSGRTVWLADSFNGFPAPDREAYPEDNNLNFNLNLSQEDFLAVPVEEVRGHFERFGLSDGIEFVEGYFEDTMPGLEGGRWSVVRLDGDTYESTLLSLRALYPGLEKGGYLILDDYGFLPECRKAAEDFRRENDITEEISAIDWTGARWRKQTEASNVAGQPALTRGEGTAGSKRVVQRQSRLSIPTLRERQLQIELEAAGGKPTRSS
jgi:hypothetical protein